MKGANTKVKQIEWKVIERARERENCFCVSFFWNEVEQKKKENNRKSLNFLWISGFC